MNVEDEYFSAIENCDTAIMLRDKKIKERDKKIEEQDQKIEEQNQMLQNVVRMLSKSGMSVEDISTSVGLSIEKVMEYLKSRN